MTIQILYSKDYIHSEIAPYPKIILGDHWECHLLLSYAQTCVACMQNLPQKEKSLVSEFVCMLGLRLFDNSSQLKGLDPR